MAADHVDLVGDNVIDPLQQVVDSDVLFDPVGRAVDAALAESGQVHHRLAEGLGRNGAGVHTDTANRTGTLDHRDALAQLGRLDGRALTGRTRSDHHQVVVKALRGRCTCHTLTAHHTPPVPDPGLQGRTSGVSSPLNRILDRKHDGIHPPMRMATHNRRMPNTGSPFWMRRIDGTSTH